jgi:hypothetical protein
VVALALLQEPLILVVAVVVAQLLLAELAVLELLLFVGHNCADKYSIIQRVLNV